MSQVPLWRRYARFFGPNPKADVRDELSFHLAAKVDDLVAQGWALEAARDEAQRQFGDLRRVQELGEQLAGERERRISVGQYLEECQLDLIYALRTLIKARSFTLVSVLILALGIGANTAVFSIVNTVLLRPLPFPDARRLVWLASDRSFSPEVKAAAGLSGVTYTVDAYEEFQRHNRSFQSVASYNPFFGNSEYTLTGSFEAQSVAAVMVSQNFFPTLEIQPALGRFFSQQECQKGGRAAALLSYAFWQRQYGGDSAIIGQNITLSKKPYTVIGVLPAEFDFGSVFAPGVKIDLFVPLVLDNMRNWGNTLALVGRLHRGVTVGRAQAEANILFPQLKAAHGDWFIDYASTITGLQEFVGGKLRRALFALWCAVGLILLIVCVNLANLLLARAVARSKEFAVRAALGARRGRLFRQLFMESLVLAGTGAALGLGLSFALISYLARQGSIALPLLRSITIDGPAVGWTLLITLFATTLFSLIPALRLASGDVQETLKDSGQGMSAGRKHERLRTGLVIAQVALAFVLLLGAGLLLRSFLNVLDVDLGFRPSQTAAIKIDYDDGGKMARRGVVLEEILRRVRAIPGVEAAGIADMLPLGRNRSWQLQAKGKQYDKYDVPIAIARVVTPGYLETMGIQLAAGRDFSWADGATSQPVVIINQAAARRFWPGEDPLGRTALVDGGETRVVGIVANVRETSVESSVGPEMYLPMMQSDPEGAQLVVRSKLPPAVLAGTVLGTLRQLNPAQPASEFQPLAQIVDQSVSPRRFFVSLAGCFAGFGLLLAALGIFGVISYSVTNQTQEIGIRMALGASPGQVQRGVMSRALRLIAVGIVTGALISLFAARFIVTLLFGIGPNDGSTFAGAILILCCAALAAGYLPAQRAARIEPVRALRNE